MYAHFDTTAFPSTDLRVTSLNSSSGLCWIFAKIMDSYIGLACDKLRYSPGRENAIYATCGRCCWLCIVGNSQNHGTFHEFQHDCESCYLSSFDENECSVSVARKLLFSTDDEAETMQLRCVFASSKQNKVDSSSGNINRSMIDQTEKNNKTTQRAGEKQSHNESVAADEDSRDASGADNVSSEEEDGADEESFFSFFSTASSGL